MSNQFRKDYIKCDVFLRKSLSDGYPETAPTRNSPIYNVRLSQPLPGKSRVGHGDGESMFFRAPNGSSDEQSWQIAYQNYFANFIRTGNPNGAYFIVTWNKRT